jgi:hypothetical protein
LENREGNRRINYNGSSEEMDRSGSGLLGFGLRRWNFD